MQCAARGPFDLLPQLEAEKIRAAAAPTEDRPARAMDKAAKESVMDALCSPRFADRSPAEVCATLLDEGVYLCSERTMYRVLADNKSVRERRAQRSHPKHPKPEIVARRPNRA